LNSIPPKDGWFTEHYGGPASSSEAKGLSADLNRKRPWQRHNTRKLDAIREEIDNLSLSSVERAIALTSLILAMDKVDSTLGHFASYLREWSPRSYNDAILQVPRVFANELEHRVIRGDVFDAAQESVDLAYYDPPYGSNNEKMPPSRVRYSAYYHLWTSICLNDRPKLFGKACRREDTADNFAPSVFEEFRRNPTTGRFLAVEAIERLIGSTKAPWIILSYSSGGRATAEELNQVIARHGKMTEVIELDYKRNVMAEMRWTNEWIREAEAPNREFLFLIERR
jgi:adenine-specific DNA-methyltransferase